jgi:hypothetical protein
MQGAFQVGVMAEVVAAATGNLMQAAQLVPAFVAEAP